MDILKIINYSGTCPFLEILAALKLSGEVSSIVVLWSFACCASFLCFLKLMGLCLCYTMNE
jgi:hypothetical protein